MCEKKESLRIFNALHFTRIFLPSGIFLVINSDTLILLVLIEIARQHFILTRTIQYYILLDIIFNYFSST